ncbi:MAG: sigma-70 family RNA polymerase sigma factor [Selenomonadaceae bacterium]
MRLEDYMAELNKIKLLSPEREAELWRAYKEDGDMAARREIISSYQPLVFKNAMAYRSSDVIMDIIQEGTVGLIEAVESYDHTKGVAFSLFAVHRIRGRMKNFLRQEGLADIAAVDVVTEDGMTRGDKIVDPSASVPDVAESHVLAEKLRESMARLPQKERLVLEEVYMGSSDVSDVAAEMNLSTSHIYRLQKTGIRRIRGMMSRFMNLWNE